MDPSLLRTATSHIPLQIDGILPGGTRADIFREVYWVFLIVGTLVGIVVIGYMLYNAYKYRDDGTRDDDNVDRPELGELPEGGGKGKKLFLSFCISAVIVVSLIIWTYTMLLYVEQGSPGAAASAEPQGDAGTQASSMAANNETMTIHVEGYQFGWEFTYPNGHKSTTLRIPEERRIQLTLTSRDVIHNFGIPAFRVKSDAMPGEVTSTWFVASKTGTYQAQCYELCGAGHSYMTADVKVMKQSAYRDWYQNTNGTTANGTATGTPGESDGTGHSKVVSP